MNIKVYDFMGASCCKSYQIKVSLPAEEKSHQELGQLLITPKKTSNHNKRPYLQQSNQVQIEDLLDEQGNTDYSNAHWLNDILASDEAMKQHLGDYFNAALTPSISDQIDWHLICIPDYYSALKQELILRQFPYNRAQTRLLWRSVALCIQHMPQLIRTGAQVGSSVAVLELMDDSYSLSLLHIAIDNGQLVPRRRAYQVDSQNYLVQQSERLRPQYTCYDSIADEFYRHSYQKGEGKKLVLSSQGYQLKEFLAYDPKIFSCSHPILEKADFCLIHGSHRAKEIHLPRNKPAITSNNDDLLQGAAKFIQASTAHQATYLDEAEALSIIVQDRQNQCIVAETLIPANSNCRGGERIVGDINKSCLLNAQSDTIVFYLLHGEVQRDIKLKELRHQFPSKTPCDQILKLHPSMIPGQGIAEVEVEAYPLLNKFMHLNFLEMHTSDKSINSLEADIELAYPIDFPEVESCPIKWSKVKGQINNYLRTGRFKSDMGSLFAQLGRKSGTKAQGIEALSLTNVFGTKSRPQEEIDFFEQLFSKLHRDYKRFVSTDDPRLKDLVRLCAWTYQSADPHMSAIAKHALNHMRNKLAHDERFPTAYHTLAACCLPTHQHRAQFLQFFMRHAQERIDEALIYPSLMLMSPYVQKKQGRGKLPEVRKVDYWILALTRIFMQYDDFLKIISTATCNEFGSYLIIILKSYLVNSKGDRYINAILKCQIFLLKRRRYDPSFMDEKSLNYQALNDILIDSNLPLAKLLTNFLQGKGSIQGLPTLLDDNA
ncbi:MAG: hypothetical protein R3Y56_01635 [Akkermansia sp.]